MKQKVLWILLPASLWGVLFCLRPVFYHPWCAVQPSPCQGEAVNALDQVVFQFHSLLADFMSNLIQNTVGVLLILLPILILRDWRRVIRLENVLIVATLWNGALLELVRTLVERPRPLVMNDPMGDGANIHQYTSFYSGHTSFVALASVLCFLWMRLFFGKNHSTPKIAGWLGIGITLLTACLRVLGGRHYPTDTLAGAIAGSLVALTTWKAYSLEAI